MARFFAFFAIVSLVGIGLFLFSIPRAVRVEPPDVVVALPSLPEPEAPIVGVSIPISPLADLPSQLPLRTPPAAVKAAYLTSWSAGSQRRVQEIVNLAKRTELNAVVMDIKDYSGYMAYRTGIPEVAASGAEKDLRIARPNALLKTLHDANLYVIARVTVFQDPVLAKAHPEWALEDKANGGVWKDRKGLAWMDPAATPVWDYAVAIARDAMERGFDEINFDYIRFASDGNLENIGYPFWDGKTSRRSVIKRFFAHLRQELGEGRISADLFGLSTVNHDDLGIGQVIEDAYEYFDYVSPMVYPSHYAPGFLGYQNPARYPYEVVKYSLQNALVRLLAQGLPSTSTPQVSLPRGRLRPWLQDFDLGARYDALMVRREIEAVEDVLNASSTLGQFAGWLLWDPTNAYTEGALQKESL